MIGFSNDLLYINLLAQTTAKLWALKVGRLKKIQTFWVRGYVLCISAWENTHKNQKGQSGRTLVTHNSVACGPKRMIFVYFERSKFMYQVKGIYTGF